MCAELRSWSHMKVLGVVGSPRKEGNTDILVEETLRGAKEAGRETEKVFLNDLRISPCQSVCTEYCGFLSKEGCTL